MKAFGYLIATAALIPGAVAQLKPAAFNLLANGWRYKGCYTYAFDLLDPSALFTDAVQ